MLETIQMLNMFSVSGQYFSGQRLRSLLDKSGGYPFKSPQCVWNVARVDMIYCKVFGGGPLPATEAIDLNVALVLGMYELNVFNWKVRPTV